MAKILKKTTRKLVTLPLETAERVEQFREKTGAASESDALKVLVEAGLQRHDTRADLFARCKAATAKEQSMGDVINLVIADHPLVESASLDAGSLIASIVRSNPEDHPVRFRFDRKSKKWFWEVQNEFSNNEWEEVNLRPPAPVAATAPPRPAAPRVGKDLDDDIPF